MYARRIGLRPDERAAVRWAYEVLVSIIKNGDASIVEALRAAAEEEASRLGIDMRVFAMRCRFPAAVRDRNLVWRAMRAKGFSYPEIGLATGYQHSAVLYGVRGYRRLQAVPA